MKILLSWLRDYVDTGDDIDALSDTLSMLGLAVEGIEQSGGIDGIVTARVVRTEVPPEAAKVQRVWVETGVGRELHVWCGAFNFAPGDVVPLAPVGTTMPDGRTLSRGAILGIDSEGMLCSARELGLGDDHSGILDSAGRRSGRRAVWRRARAAPRRGVRHRCHAATGPTAGRTSVWRATSRPRRRRPSRRPAACL